MSQPEARGILCSGSIIFDTLVQPFEESAWGTTTFVKSMECHLGGNGANTARALAMLGTAVRLLGALGEDTQAEFILDQLRDAGVDTSGVTRIPAPTAATIVLVNGAGDRQFLHRLGVSALAFEHPVEFTRGMVGLTTSLDTNWDAEGKWMSALRPCLPRLDILFMNEDEARMVTGCNDAARGAEVVLREGVTTAVMKLGSRGCAIYSGEDEILCPAFDVCGSGHHLGAGGTICERGSRAEREEAGRRNRHAAV
jgi:sugar/nucleoside kinase (ribokinase family)